MESTRQADHRMACAVRQKLIAADEQIQVRHSQVHLLHDTRAVSVCLDELHRRSEVGAADFHRPRASFRPLFDRRQQTAACNGIKESRGFHVTNKIHRLD